MGVRCSTVFLVRRDIAVDAWACVMHACMSSIVSRRPPHHHTTQNNAGPILLDEFVEYLKNKHGAGGTLASAYVPLLESMPVLFATRPHNLVKLT